MTAPDANRPCEVYWGSHGCDLRAGHDGYCRCDCANDPTLAGPRNVGAHPYYGPMTLLWGRDVAEVWGLPIDDLGGATQPLSSSPRWRPFGRDNRRFSGR